MQHYNLPSTLHEGHLKGRLYLIACNHLGDFSEGRQYHIITQLMSCVHGSGNRFENKDSGCRNPNALDRI